ncbi:MAG: PilN domain-containing protein [Candidatus Saccharimonadales bacterium]
MSAVQFNLLPDIKLKYVQAQRTKNKVVSLSILISAVALGIFLLLLAYTGAVQRKQLSDADKNIAAKTTELKAIPEIEKVLTVQNQLQTLSTLHADKHVTSRVFDYLSQVTPAQVSLSRLSLDFATNVMMVEGSANSQASVNQFIDTLKFTKYKVGEAGQEGTAFPSVIESSFSIVPPNVSYSLTVSFDPELFIGSQGAPTLQVPSRITTHSSLDALFEGAPR